MGEGSNGERDDGALLIVQSYIRQHCIIHADDTQVIFARNGRKSRWIFDLRPLLLDGRMLGYVSNLFWEKMQQFWPFQVAGLEIASIPLIAGIVLEGNRRGYPSRGLIVRQKRKKYGREKLVEGEPAPSLPVVLIDDVINSAKSINKALLAIKGEGLTTIAAFSVISFRSTLAQEWSARNNSTMHYLFTNADFGLTLGREEKYSTIYSAAWRFSAPKPNYGYAVPKSEPVIYRDSLMFGSDSGIFWSLDKRTGNIKWSFDAKVKGRKGIVSSPVVADGRVYFGAYNGTLFCLDASSGEEIWRNRACDWIGSSPCYVDGYVFIGLEYKIPGVAGGLAKFCAVTGARQWEVPTRLMLHGSPVYSEKHTSIIVGTNDGTVLVIDAKQGAVHCLLKVGGPVKYHCALAGDIAIFGSFDGNIYFWDFVANSVKCALKTGDIVYSRPLVLDRRVFVGCADHSLRVLSLDTLREEHRLEVGERVLSSPALVGQTVFFGTSAGELIGIDRSSLAITHRWQFPERLTNAVVYDDGLLYVSTYDNKICAVPLMLGQTNNGRLETVAPAAEII